MVIRKKIVVALALILLAYPHVSFASDTQTNHPIEPKTLVQDWVVDTLPKLINFTPQNLDTKLEEDKKYFVGRAWENFIASLTHKGVLDRVRNKGVTYTMELTGLPEVYMIDVEKNATGGISSWSVTIPATLREVPGEAISPPDFGLVLEVDLIYAHGQSRLMFAQWHN